VRALWQNEKTVYTCCFFWRFQAATQVYIIHKVAPRNYRYAIQIDNLVFVY